MAKAVKTTEKVELPALNIQAFEITLVGDSPLICHAWSQKAKQMMLDKQMKKAKVAKAAKDPDQDYQDSLYPHPEGGYGFPSVAFKAAAVGACRAIDGITMVQARGAFHVIGELVKIDGDPKPREDMVRIAGQTSDIRFRGEFPQWKTTFLIRYNASVLTAEQIINLFNHAGFHVGVGENRPEKSGNGFGMFHVAMDGEGAV